MSKNIFIYIICISFSIGSDSALELSSVITEHINDNGEKKTITVERYIDPICKNIHITNEVFWQGNYASSKVPEACKSTFITSGGKMIFPIQLAKEVETYGEVEVLSFIKQMQKDDSMLLIDTRGVKSGISTVPYLARSIFIMSI